MPARKVMKPRALEGDGSPRSGPAVDFAIIAVIEIPYVHKSGRGHMVRNVGVERIAPSILHEDSVPWMHKTIHDIGAGGKQSSFYFVKDIEQNRQFHKGHRIWSNRIGERPADPEM